MMLRAFLTDLIRSYQIQGDEENSALLIGLFSYMDMKASSKKVSELTPEDIINFTKTTFKPGHCVCYKRYGYRDIIVDLDQDCTVPTVGIMLIKLSQADSNHGIMSLFMAQTK